MNPTLVLLGCGFLSSVFKTCGAEPHNEWHWLYHQNFMWCGMGAGWHLALWRYGDNKKQREFGRFFSLVFLAFSVWYFQWLIMDYLEVRHWLMPTWHLARVRQWILGITLPIGIISMLAAWHFKRVDPLIHSFICLSVSAAMLEWEYNEPPLKMTIYLEQYRY